jgi:hypothetical protein
LIRSGGTDLPTTTATAGTVHDELLLSFGSKVDTNKAGLRRAKKVNFAAFAKGKVKVEPTMEVCTGRTEFESKVYNNDVFRMYIFVYIPT